ncbi:MAG: helix-turn-helix transcriptional regulator [Thomasclavelia sp.]
MNNIDTTLIGKYIKSIRLSKGWSQAKLEYLSGISASSISNIEHGNKGISYNMSIPAIVKIAHAFQMSFYDILNDSGFLSYIGDQQFAQNKSQIYITNHELINLFNRLSPSDNKNLLKNLRTCRIIR